MDHLSTRTRFQRTCLTIFALTCVGAIIALCAATFVKNVVYNGGPPPWLTPTATVAPTSTVFGTVQPATPTRGVVEAEPTPTSVAYTARERLAYFHDIWDIVDKNYVYRDFNGVDWAAVEHQYDERIRAAHSTAEFYTIVQEAIDLLNDDHSRFDSPQQTFEEDAVYTGSAGYAGIGVMLRELTDSILIIRLGKNGPADRAGVRVYDRIVAIDDRTISDFYAKGDDYGAAVRGEIGSTVTLTVRRGDTTTTIPIVRNAIPGDAFPEATAQLIPGTRIQLLTIDSFNRDQLRGLIVNALKDNMPSDGPVSGVIIDVRENGGGEINAMQQTIGIFADGGIIGTSVGRNSNEPLRAEKGRVLAGYDTIPIAVLIGPGTVSAAEMFASGMHSRRKAILVGNTSAGNTENLYPYEFDDGAVLWLAEVLFRQNDGTYIDNVGVIPDIEVPESDNVIDLMHDPVIQAAVAALQ